MTWTRRAMLKGAADWSDADYLADLKSKCIVTDRGCWEWQGFRFKPPRHYGGTSYRGKNMSTHRMAYIITKGPIPKGMLVMHSCDNPPCCNPDHLSLGTHLQNMADCRAKNRYYYANLTHCKHGHEFTPENTYIIPTPGETFGLRQCKECHRRAHRERYRRNRDVILQRRREAARRKKEASQVTPPFPTVTDSPHE